MLFGSHLLSAPLVGIDITPGVHPQVKLGGLTFDVDIIWATVDRRSWWSSPWA